MVKYIKKDIGKERDTYEANVFFEEPKVENTKVEETRVEEKGVEENIKDERRKKVD